MASKGSFKDICGLKFGRLTVIRYAKHYKNLAWFLCKCDCGNEVEVRGSYLRFEKTKSCGCIGTVKMVGKKFGKLLVLSLLGKDTKNKLMFKCMCDCGNLANVRGPNLRNGNTKSCGCATYSKTIDMHGFENKYFKVLKFAGLKGPRKAAFWECTCLKCGNIALIKGQYLRNKRTKSCGCLLVKHPYRKYHYDGITFRSSYEVIIAIKLHDAGIKYNYEPESFLISINGKNARYTPDFYLPQYDLWLEVKGHDLVGGNIDKFKVFSTTHKSKLITKDLVSKLLNVNICNIYYHWKKSNYDPKSLVDFLNDNNIYDLLI